MKIHNKFFYNSCGKIIERILQPLYMKKILTALILLLITSLSAQACPSCNPEIRKAIFDSTFYPNLLTMLLAFLVLAFVVVILSVLSAKRYRANVSKYPTRQILTPVPLTTTSIIIGIGIGGFIDGIVLHQLLQWHEMLSNKIPPTDYVSKSVNMFWDGIFHAFTLIVTFVGIILLWKLTGRRDINRSRNLFAGGLWLGWGLFNIIEGVVDHHLLKLHNVKEISMNKEVWNYGFLGISVLMILLGWYLLNKKSEHH